MYSIYDFVNIYMGNFKSTFRSMESNIQKVVLIKFSYKILDIVCTKKKKNRKE